MAAGCRNSYFSPRWARKTCRSKTCLALGNSQSFNKEIISVVKPGSWVRTLSSGCGSLFYESRNSTRDHRLSVVGVCEADADYPKNQQD